MASFEYLMVNNIKKEFNKNKRLHKTKILNINNILYPNKYIVAFAICMFGYNIYYRDNNNYFRIVKIL